LAPGYLTNIVAARHLAGFSWHPRRYKPDFGGKCGVEQLGHRGQTNWLNGASLDSSSRVTCPVRCYGRFASAGECFGQCESWGDVVMQRPTTRLPARRDCGTNGLVKTNSGTLTILTTNSYAAPRSWAGTLEVRAGERGQTAALLRPEWRWQSGV